MPVLFITGHVQEGIPMILRAEYCMYCGGALLNGTPHRKCSGCNQTVYCNPKPVAIVIIPILSLFRRRVLLITRGGTPGSPGHGCEALPGGFQDSNECSSRAAAREAEEETGIALDHASLTLFDVEYAEQADVQMLFWLARPVPESALRNFTATDEVLGYRLCDRPPETLAFASHARVLRRYFSRWDAFLRMWSELRRVIGL